MCLVVRALGKALLDMAQANLLLQQPMVGDIARIITDAVLVKSTGLSTPTQGLVLTMIGTDVPLLGNPCLFMARHSPADRIMGFIFSCPQPVHGKLFQNLCESSAVDIAHCLHLLPHCKQYIWNMYDSIPY